MTTEKLERLKQIRERLLNQTAQPTRDEADFLLSLLITFPDPRHWEPVEPFALPDNATRDGKSNENQWYEYVLGFCPEKGRGNAILSVEGELTLLGKNVVKNLSERVATAMRSRCVEKVRAIDPRFIGNWMGSQYVELERVVETLEAVTLEQQGKQGG